MQDHQWFAGFPNTRDKHLAVTRHIYVPEKRNYIEYLLNTIECSKSYEIFVP